MSLSARVPVGLEKSRTSEVHRGAVYVLSENGIRFNTFQIHNGSDFGSLGGGVRNARARLPKSYSKSIGVRLRLQTRSRPAPAPLSSPAYQPPQPPLRHRSPRAACPRRTALPLEWSRCAAP